MQQEIYITSLIIQVHPSVISVVIEKLESHKELEIAHSETLAGKIIVIIESDSLVAIQQHIDRINSLTGVVSTTMVYQHCETGSALDEVLA